MYDIPSGALQIGALAGRASLSGLSSPQLGGRRRHVSGPGEPPPTILRASYLTDTIYRRRTKLARLLTAASVQRQLCGYLRRGLPLHELRRQPQSPRRSVCMLCCGPDQPHVLRHDCPLCSDHERQVLGHGYEARMSHACAPLACC